MEQTHYLHLDLEQISDRVLVSLDLPTLILDIIQALTADHFQDLEQPLTSDRVQTFAIDTLQDLDLILDLVLDGISDLLILEELKILKQ